LLIRQFFFPDIPRVNGHCHKNVIPNRSVQFELRSVRSGSLCPRKC